MNQNAARLLNQSPENEVRRFTVADIPKYGALLLPRMCQKWPQINNLNFAGKIRQIMDSNATLFVRTAQAVGLADITYDQFDARPVARVAFVWQFMGPEHLTLAESKGLKQHEINTLVRNEANRQAVKIVRAVQAWAQGLGAKRVDLGENIDMDPGKMTSQIAPKARTENWIEASVGSHGRPAKSAPERVGVAPPERVATEAAE